MLRLHMLQAAYGDCLLLECGAPDQPKFVLIDGGPPATYQRCLRSWLQQITARGGMLDLLMLSHVDNDHIVGLLDLTAELREQRANAEAPIVAIDALWHNSFGDTIGSGNDVEPRLRAATASAGVAAQALAATGIALQGIGEGRRLRTDARLLNIPINAGWPDGRVLAGGAPALTLADVSLQVVGPTLDNLADLQRAWKEWLDKHEPDLATGNPRLAAMADRSIPNLSSIMALATCQGRTLLLTGDGRGDHLLQGLKQAGLLDSKGRIHVDVLKLPHHGSDRNVTRKFFQTVTADRYVASADGLHGNPDLATLIWIVEAARKQKRKIEIIVANQTPSVDKLISEYAAATYGYTVTVMPVDAPSLAIDIAP